MNLYSELTRQNLRQESPQYAKLTLVMDILLTLIVLVAQLNASTVSQYTVYSSIVAAGLIGVVTTYASYKYLHIAEQLREIDTEHIDFPLELSYTEGQELLYGGGSRTLVPVMIVILAILVWMEISFASAIVVFFLFSLYSRVGSLIYIRETFNVVETHAAIATESVDDADGASDSDGNETDE